MDKLPLSGSSVNTRRYTVKNKTERNLGSVNSQRGRNRGRNKGWVVHPQAYIMRCVAASRGECLCYLTVSDMWLRSRKVGWKQLLPPELLPAAALMQYTALKLVKMKFSHKHQWLLTTVLSLQVILETGTQEVSCSASKSLAAHTWSQSSAPFLIAHRADL